MEILFVYTICRFCINEYITKMASKDLGVLPLKKVEKAAYVYNEN
jgi:hypothetical protein